MFKVGHTSWEWTILVDTFNNEILAHSVTSVPGSNKPYYHCLDVLKKLIDKREEQTSPVVFHTDQGAVYSSQAFAHAHAHYTIVASYCVARAPQKCACHRQAGVLRTPSADIITYFVPCREGELQRITLLSRR